MIFPLGTLVNVLAIIAGGFLGVALGSRLPDRIRMIVFQAIGLCTLVLGFSMALKSAEMLIMFGSIIIGAVLGEILRLEQRFASLGNWLKKRLGASNPEFTNGVISATMLFCVGSMAILGPFSEALLGDRTLLYTKSMLDGITSIAFAAAFGAGVILSTVPLFIYQGCLTVFASLLAPLLPEAILTELTAVGGLLIVGIGFNLLKIKEIPLLNFMPSLVVVVVLANIAL